MMGRCYSAARGFLLHRPALRGSRGMLVGTAVIALALAGCGPSYQSARWDGRRGYDGNGVSGYDAAAPRKAAIFEGHAGHNYPAPGSPDDPWGPYIHEAATRFSLPRAWIRAVMRQESGGRQTSARTAPPSPPAPGRWD